MSIFIDREYEFEILKERYKSGRAEFLIIYGRRRIGKTELVEQFISKNNIRGIRLMAREESKHYQLKRFKEKLSDFFKDDYLKKIEWRTWDSFFEYLFTKTYNRRVLIAIDEFPYLVKEDPSILSTLQDCWDEKLKKSKIFLILLGSSISMMEKMMSFKSPLYGRRTGQIKLKPLRFMDLYSYIKDIQKLIEFYSVFGGSPAYIMESNIHKSILWNIKNKILKVDSFIYRDVEFILREELDEPRYYFSILHAISLGNHKIGNICNETGLSKSIVSKYLSVLIDLHIVKREIPVTENYRSKKGLYFLEDNMFDFWFRFVYPYIDLIESRKIDTVVENKIAPQLNAFIGKKFENIAKELIERLEKKNYTKIGKWWYKDKEIDILATDEQTKEMLALEVKWQDLKIKDVKNIMEDLHNKVEYVEWHNEKRKENLGILARKIDKKAKEWLLSKGYRAWDLKDVEKVINTNFNSSFKEFNNHTRKRS